MIRSRFLSPAALIALLCGVPPAQRVEAAALPLTGSALVFHDPALGLDVVGAGVLRGGAAFGLRAPLLDAAAPAGALFLLAEDGSGLLDGALIGLSAIVDPDGGDALRLRFESLSGPLADAFGGAALLTLTGAFGPDPLGAGFAGATAPAAASFTLAAAGRPTAAQASPAGLLALSALWLLEAAGLRRARRAARG